MNRIKKIKGIVSDVLHTDTAKKGFIYIIDDYLISGLIVLNVVAIILESYEGHYEKYEFYYHAFEIFSVAIFSIEYILRIWIADLLHKNASPLRARLKYIFSVMGLIDLLAVVPFYLPFLITMDLRFLRILRLMRLFRIFKLAHYSRSLRLVGDVISKRKQELLITVFGTFIIILVTSSLMFEIEHDVQPEKFSNIFSTFWWAVATLTTIGYGDVYPITGWGQLLAGITAIFGIGMVAIPTGILSMGFMEEITLRAKKENDESQNKEHKGQKLNYCPHCGEKLIN